jgi:predicted RNA-binding protein (virulence factor B family)
MLDIGNYNDLIVKTRTTVGVYLTDETDDVLLPTKYVPENIAIGDRLEVFVYLDNENRPIATTIKPFATINEFAFLSVKEINSYGAFLDWGISKDLFVSYEEQRNEMTVGQSYLVYIFLDDFSGRIAASTKWRKFLESAPEELENGEEVELLIAEKTNLGYRAIIDNRFEGMLYANEIFETITVGDRKRGYVRQIREDGKIDLRLHQEGYSHIEEAKLILLSRLKASNGILELGDKSSPEEIYNQLQMSKKAFKKAIGGLYKERKIVIEENRITLIENKA